MSDPRYPPVEGAQHEPQYAPATNSRCASAHAVVGRRKWERDGGSMRYEPAARRRVIDSGQHAKPDIALRMGCPDCLARPTPGVACSTIRDDHALLGCRRKLRVLPGSASNVIPRCLGIDENMHVELNARVTVDSTESYPMHLIIKSSAERCSAGATEAKTPSWSRIVVREVFGTPDP